MAGKKTCYIIGPIGKPDSEERKWADFVRDYIIKPAVNNCGYENPMRSDEDPRNPLIMMGIMEQIFNADLIIADLTDENPNVFYELGICDCMQKPVINLIKDGQEPPFDLGGNKAIFVDDKHLTVQNAISAIQRRIEAIEKDPKQFYSHVQLYLQKKELDLLKKVGTTLDKAMIDAFAVLVQSIKSQEGMLRELHNELVEKPKQWPDYGQIAYRYTPGALQQTVLRRLAKMKKKEPQENEPKQ